MKKGLSRIKYYNFHSKITGDMSGVSGNLSGVRGDLSDCKITDEERKRGIMIEELIGD